VHRHYLPITNNNEIKKKEITAKIITRNENNKRGKEKIRAMKIVMIVEATI